MTRLLPGDIVTHTSSRVARDLFKVLLGKNSNVTNVFFIISLIESVCAARAVELKEFEMLLSRLNRYVFVKWIDPMYLLIRLLQYFEQRASSQGRLRLE